MGNEKQVRVAIIGAGVSGVMLAINLQQRLGLESVTIYEKNTQAIGGTWRDNTYPGVACDVPSHFYSFSKELNANWSKAFSGSEEIQAYWLNIHKKYDLQSKTRLDSRFVSAVWNEANQGYVVQFEQANGTPFTVECEVLVSAIGALHVPVVKGEDLEGLSKFQGVSFHSARWDHSVDLKDKKIAIIGSGCSASQIVPVVSLEKSTQVVNFMRTPNWYLPRPQAEYSAFDKFAFAYVPGYMRLHRYKIAFNLEFNSIIFPLKYSAFRNYVEEGAMAHMKSTAPEKYHQMLTPQYPIGCKRIIVDPGYCESLNRSNVELIDSPIAEITETGIKTVDGREHVVDVIVTATGFDTSAGGYALNISGRNGGNLEDQWQRQSGPQAYLGTVVNNFPNFFTLLGPNVATGHSSVIFSSEAQINLVVGLVSALVDGATSVEVKIDAEKAYNTEIANRLVSTVWNGGCTSWYQVGGKLVSTWPGTLTEFYFRTRKPQWEAYRLQGTSRSLAGEAQRAKYLRMFSLTAIIVALRVYGLRTIRTQGLAFILAQYQNVLALAKQIRA